MSITIVTKLQCDHDGCEASMATNGEETKAIPRPLRKEAKSMGWSRIAGADYCASHRPTIKRVVVPAE